MLERTDLFEGGKDGYALYRIPGLVVTAKGTVLAYCEARKTGKSDWDRIDIMLRRSTDGGKSWEPRRQIVKLEGAFEKNPVALAQKLGNPGEITVNNPVAIVDRQAGAVHFLYCVEYCRCFYMRSDDDGQTFSAPMEITAAFENFRPEYAWKVLATGPGHGIQLCSGRLLVPVWLSTGTGGGAHRPSVTSVVFSDDHGQIWQRGEIAVPNTAQFVDPNETVAAELSDGRVLLNVRSESPNHRRIVVTSPDGAAQWSKPRFDDALFEPICMASMLRLSGKPGQLLFVNPDSSADKKAGWAFPRRNLTARLSRDDGQTWPVARVLDPGPAGYSDLAELPDGTILCFYEAGCAAGDKVGTSTKFLAVIRFGVDWLEHGKF